MVIICYSSIGLDENGYQVNSFLIFNKNICCGYSLEAPRRGASNEYPQHMFSSSNKKHVDTFLVEKKRLIKTLQSSLPLSMPR